MSSLTLESEERVLAQRDLYARIDVQRYRVDEEGTDRELLSALVASHAYGNFKYDLGSQGAHGPYLQKHLSAESFRASTAAEASAALEAWLGDPRQPTVEESAALAERILPLLAGALYRLSVDQEGPLSIGATWLEFVAIDRTSGHLLLIVAWDD